MTSRDPNYPYTNHADHGGIDRAPSDAGPVEAGFPAHFPVPARHQCNGMDTVVFFYQETSGVSLRLPPGTSHVQFTPEQFTALRAGLNTMNDALGYPP